MATQKTWTAYDLALGALKLTRTLSDGGNQAIQFEQRYDYEDDLGGILQGVAGSRLTDIVELADIPAGILAALTTINAWLYARCLEKEGMA